MCSFQTLEVRLKKMAAARSPPQLALNVMFPLVVVLHLVVLHPHRIQVHLPLRRLHPGLAHLEIAQGLAHLDQVHLYPTVLLQLRLQ